MEHKRFIYERGINMKKWLMLLILLLWSSNISASSWQIQTPQTVIPATPCINFHTDYCVLENFPTDNLTSGQIGTHGWSFGGLGGSLGTHQAKTNSPGVGLDLLTDGTINHQAWLRLARRGIVNDYLAGTTIVANFLMSGYNKLPSSNFRGGLVWSSAVITAPPSNIYFNGVWIECLQGDTDWFFVTSNSLTASHTRVDLGIPPCTTLDPTICPSDTLYGMQRITITQSADHLSWTGCVEGHCATINTTLPPVVASYGPFYQVFSGDNVADDFFISYFSIEQFGLSR